MADYDPKARRARPTPAADEPAAVDALLEIVEHAHDPAPQDANGSRSAVSVPEPESASTPQSKSASAPGPEPEPESTAASTSAQVKPIDASGGASAGDLSGDPVVPPNPWVSSVPEPAGGKGRLVVMALAALAAVVVVLTLLRRRRP